MRPTLACPHHDPDGLLVSQAVRVLPLLQRIFGGIALHVTDATPPTALEPWRAVGAVIETGPAAGHRRLGSARRGALAVALQLGAPQILFCDLDRALFWAEQHGAELERTAAQISTHDFTVLGRTDAAFNSHPATQRDTERIINECFARVSGQPWDITAAARGLSARAAHYLVEHSTDDTVGTDASWPLVLQRAGGFSLNYLATEGLAFETPDRYPEAVRAAGSRVAWTDALDADLSTWVLRLDIARIEVEAMLPFR